MRIINIIDICGQLLSRIGHSSNSADRETESFFHSKHKIVGSKERKFISDTVYSTIRNLFLIKKIAKLNDFIHHLNHPNVFINAPEQSIYILIQLVLTESFPKDFSSPDLTSVRYKIDGIPLSIVDSINQDLLIIKDSDNFRKFLDKNFIQSIQEYFSALNEKIINQRANIQNYCKNNANKIQNVEKYLNSNKAKDLIELLSERYSFDSGFLQLWYDSVCGHLQDVMQRYFTIIQFAESMSTSAFICLRVNNSLSKTADILDELHDLEINCSLGNISPACISLPMRVSLIELDMYKQGKFVIQDEASQLVGYCANPHPNDNILDCCAGAGGKSLHLADLQADSGNIVASDISYIKLKEISKRAALSGFKSISTVGRQQLIGNSSNNIKNKFARRQLTSDSRIPLTGKFDIVVVDAPCTGGWNNSSRPYEKIFNHTKDNKQNF